MTQTVSPRRPIHFCFANPAGFSGQKAAAELVLDGLARRGWSCRRLPQPVFDRESGSSLARLRYFLGVLGAWWRSGRLLGARGAWLWLGLGQTRMAFLRDAIPLLSGRLGLGRSRVIVSLNGAVFMQWAKESLEARIFRFLLNQAGLVTVVGERQRARLIELGVPRERVKVVVNTCVLDPAVASAVVAKHPVATDVNRVVRCLHLSSLIDTKGFPEYLEALRRISASSGPRIEAVLCGRLVGSEFSERFRDAAAAEKWIEEQIGEINRSPGVRVRWIKGAAGADKAALFREAEIFVLPTRYAVEAQPLVLLEAMAAGCAIVTTTAGEIPTILDRETAVFLETAGCEALAAELQKLAADAGTRSRLARAAHARFMVRYRLERHLDTWEGFLGSTANPGGTSK